ncbi:PREDICTED: mpv17-like protein [Acromyrmex echinatior]|uniref:Mpv17-like protein n=1 Tax=Acromyrmex echinatior TaxID=103372 RepID=F4WSR8_ACREC|nr:PREDICTED: mpv17-like protein [Acromyrmex echinatior]XP_011058974.1 PREDICTED: mpv17-like protein [Acromyrmex echinatior]XP_011058975.1 PREDICTED: mpv17-like protein [Acromyrmex echinatior]EGI62725.1 Mpv17-like protein [Acromyrmex echinatior]
MRIIFIKFREISQKYPIIRGMASYSIIWPTGNFLQHKIMGKEEFNYMEAVRFSLYGGLYVAPTLYCWLKCASHFWPKADLKSAIIKALIEQVTYGPAAMCSFFFGMSLLELKPVSECIDEVKIKFWPTYKIAICVWPILQTINFILIPERNRVVYVSICSLIWTCFLAYMKSLEAKQKESISITNINPKIISESKAQTNERANHMQIPLLR